MASTGSKVLDHMTAHADMPQSIKAIADATGLTEMQSANAAANLMEKFPQMTRPRRGVYMWTSEAVVPEEVLPTEFIVTVVIRKDDGRCLVKDENDNLFVLSPFTEF